MTSLKPLLLAQSATLRISVKMPFDFRHTFWKPSHFVTGLEVHSPTTSWRTFRIGPRYCGVRCEFVNRQVEVSIYADRSLNPAELEQLRARIAHSYGLVEDQSEFLSVAAKHPAMHAPLRRFRGMRQSCPENLFEIAIISLLLQNATIQRTRQMMDNLLRHHGRIVRFDKVELRAFFTPVEIGDISEELHREQNRLGYRAKYIPRFSEFFRERGDLLSAEVELLAQFQNVKGVGPYTTAIVASHASRDPSALGLDVWNRKILAKCLLGVEDAPPKEVMSACNAAFPGYEGLAALYLLEFEYIDRPLAPLVAENEDFIRVVD
jgi:3-methyladenine DNA glycosylase/8-oxoguanine DNA glycosylase